MSFVRKILPSVVVLIVFLLDRITKNRVTSTMDLGETIPVLPFFNLSYVHNTGMAFGLGQGQNRVFIFMAVALLAALLIMRRRWEQKHGEDMVMRMGIALVIGGALGNLYDRIALGSVIDFLDFFIGGYHWPAFNVADAGICVGAGLLIFSQWNESKRAQEKVSD